MIEESQVRDNGQIWYFISYPSVNRLFDKWVCQDHVKTTSQKPKQKQKQENYFNNNEDENMTEEEVRRHLEMTRVKTIEKLDFGDFDQDCWYYSPVPQHLQKPTLYTCDCCLGFFVDRY